LVEHGACVFATTLSDAEMPASKCEETEDGYAGCAQYLEMADRCTGIINDGLVYAAYSYDAEIEDELTFEEGDQLKVLNRDGDEKMWWLCEHIASGATGLVPRNYLCLYPIWKHVERNDFQHFEIPQTISPNQSREDVESSIESFVKDLSPDGFDNVNKEMMKEYIAA
jgi:hypothetical protein